jgi:hypothetical protein
LKKKIREVLERPSEVDTNIQSCWVNINQRVSQLEARISASISWKDGKKWMFNHIPGVMDGYGWLWNVMDMGHGLNNIKDRRFCKSDGLRPPPTCHQVAMHP